MILYMGRFVTQYRKSENARLMMKIVVYFNGDLLKPKMFLDCAHGIANNVMRFPTAPRKATIKHLKKIFHF